MDDDLNTISKDIYTVSGLKKRLRVLRSYFSKNFFGAPFTDLSENDLLWINSLPKSFLSQFEKSNLTQKLYRLENKSNQLPFLTMYLPFEANGETAKLIGSMVRQLFNPNLFLDIKYDPSLLAGCALVWKGIYKDYSLKERIEERKGEILEGFKKFLR